MKKTIAGLTFLFLSAIVQNLFAQPTLLYKEFKNGSGNGFDEVKSIVTDAVGNLYATGISDGAGTGSDFLTVKLDPKGNELWRITYNGTASASDIPIRILLDSSGYVYVVGSSMGTSTGYDIAVVKYDTGNGTLQNNFPVRVNASSNLDDKANDAILHHGALFVGGSTTNMASSVSARDMYLVRIEANGTLTWQNWYGPSNTGDEAFNTIAAYNDRIYASAFSNPGYMQSPALFRTLSFDETTGNFSSVGSIPGANDITPVDMLANASGVYIAGTKSNTFYLEKNNSTGTQQWLKSRAGIVPTAIDDDASSNIYVTGYRGTNNHDIITLKYNNSGVLVWIDSINGTGNGNDEGMALVIGNQTNPTVYIAGFTTISSGKKQATILAYKSSDGTLLYQLNESCSTNGSQLLNCIALDSYNNIYAGGSSECGVGSDADYLALKYCNTFPAKPTITVQSLPNLTLITSNPGLNNQWWLNGSSIPGANNNTYSITNSSQFGYYQTEVSYNGCATISDSLLVNSIVSGIEAMQIGSLSVYPNPATAQLFIETNGIAVTEVSIYNTTGSLVSQAKQPQTKSIDISQLTNGVYIAEIKTKDASVKRRWVKM